MDKKLAGLVISPVFPLPANTGALVRIYNLAKGLKEKYNITFASPVSQPFSKSGLKGNNDFFDNFVCGASIASDTLTKVKALFSLSPYHVAQYYSPDLQQKIIRLIRQNNYSFIFCNFIYSLTYLTKIKTDVPIFVDQQNVDTEYWYRKIVTSKNIFVKSLSYVNLEKTNRYEKRWLSRIQGYISVSNIDRQKTIDYAYPTVQNFIVAPNGVDIDKYIPKQVREFNRAITIGYLGSFDLEINQNAAALIIQKIVPEIRKLFPEYKINGLMIGRNPPGKLLKLTNHDPLISFTGTIDEPSEFLKKIDIFVAPIIGGGGTKLKLFEAMASGIPTVGTKYLYEGVDEIENGIHALIAENEEEITKKICMLINDETLYRDISINGRKLIEQYYSWKEITIKLSEQLEIIRNK